MVINSSILTVSPIVYYLMLIPIIGMWTYSVWNKCEKNTKGWYVDKLFMVCLDILPVFLLPFFNVRSWQLELFIILITLSISVIRVNDILGAISYAIIYLTIGLDAMITNWCLIVFLISCLIIFGFAIYVLTIKNLSKLYKSLAIIYGFLVLVPILYYFVISLNIGFLCIVVGDILLGVSFIQQINNKNNKKIAYISNSFFYVGVWLSALSLV